MTNKFKFVVGAALALALVVSASASAAYMHSVTLKYGSRGAQVSELQSALNVSPATGYFGTKTKAAVMSFQASKGLKADGVVGPTTGAAIAALGSTSTGNLPAGCSSTAGFSSLTGVKCDGASSSVSTGALTGTAGDITVTSYSSGLKTQVGEGETAQKILGFEVKADAGSDVAINSVKVQLQKSSGSGSTRASRYADTVSVWAEDGTKLGSSSVSDFSESSSVYSRSISLSNVVVRADKKARFFVSVDAVDNIDSGDQNTYWTATLDSIRFSDASGAILTDSTTVSKTFQFTSLASASDVELKVNLSSSNLKAQTVKVSTTSQTNGVELLKFTMKAQGSKMVIDQIPVTLTSTTTGVASITGNVTLNIDGQSFSESVSGSGTSLTVLFNDLNLSFDKDETVTGTVTADINSLTGNYAQGETLAASISSSLVTATSGNYIDVEDVNGDQLVTGDRSGSAIGENMTFRSTGVNVVMGSPSISYQANSGNAGSYDSATYSVPVSVTSFGNTLYIPQAAQLASTVSGSYAFAVAFQKSAAPSTDVVSGVTSTITVATSNATLESGAYRLDDGQTKNFTVTVNLFGGNTAAAYRVALKQIQTFTSSSLVTGTAQTLLPVEQFQTNYQNITK